MVCKNSQRNADDKKTGGITEHFPQHEAVYKLGIGHAGADESRQKKNNHLYHAPKGGSGDHHAVSHRQVVEQSDALLVDPFGHLPANRLTFLLNSALMVILLAPPREEIASSSPGRTSESLLSSFSTLSPKMPTAL